MDAVGSRRTPVTASAVLAELAQVPLLAAAGPAAAADLLPHVRLQVFPAGRVVVRQGDPSDGLWIVLSGRVALQSGTQGRMVSMRGPQDLLGEAAVLTATPWAFDARAMTDVAAVHVPRAPLRRWLAAHPAAADWLLTHLARRLVAPAAIDRHAGEHPDVRARVAGTLLALAERHTVDGVVRHGLSQQRLAGLVGASREAVNKALAEFARCQAIRVLRGGCVILDEPALRARAAASHRPAAPPPGRRPAQVVHLDRRAAAPPVPDARSLLPGG